MITNPDSFYDNVRGASRQVWDGIHALLTLQAQHAAGDYGNTLPDGTGNNTGLTKTEVGAACFATADALKTVLDAGHASNLEKLL